MNRTICALTAAILCLLPSLARASLTCSAQKVELHDAFEGQQLLVSDAGRDVTREVTYQSADPKIAAVDAKGYVTSCGNGAATLRITLGTETLDVPVVVSGFTEGRAVDFRTEIAPLLSKLGCNAGGCHGKASGQNGFKLSLFGFDSSFDFAALTREGRGRRIFFGSPDESLLLRKASGKAPHGGGKRLDPAGSDYQVIRRWIAAGAPASAPDVPRVVKLRISPSDGVLRPGDRRQLAVVAD